MIRRRLFVRQLILGILSFFFAGSVCAAGNARYTVQTVASFSTELTGKDDGRRANIILAARAINGEVVKPGAVFSFNEAVGPTIKENGYQVARVFVNGRDSEGYGGGVCQVSSTLYNTVKQAGMKIVERHPHTKRVYYVPKDCDAATAFGRVDFRFENNKTIPVRISTAVKDGVLKVNLETLTPAS